MGIGDRFAGTGHERVGKSFAAVEGGVEGCADGEGGLHVGVVDGAIDAAVAPLVHQVMHPLFVRFEEDVADREQHVQRAAIADGAALAVAQLI